MTVRVGINGFGRIGRNFFRAVAASGADIEIVGVNDLTDNKVLAHLLKFDTILGRFPDEVSARDGHLYVAGRQVKMLSAEKPGDVNWGDLGVETVIEATAKFRTRAELERHLEMGAKRVILCTPPADPPDSLLARAAIRRCSIRRMDFARSSAHHRWECVCRHS